MAESKPKAKFIVLDGVDGCGKSEQLERLAEALDNFGLDVVATFEPGGTEAGKAIREILLHRLDLNLSPRAEALLFSAARAQLVQEVIDRESKVANVILCDRFDSATFAYQGFAGGVPLKLVEELTTFATTLDPLCKPISPDLEIILDLDPAIGFERKKTDLDRIEQRGIEYHQRVREGFLEYAKWHPEFCEVIDASGTVAEVHLAIIAVVKGKFGWKIEPVL